MNNFDPDRGKTDFARHLYRLRRHHLRLSQRAFAERFGLTYSVVRDAEQGARPTSALRLVVAAIADDPSRMEVVARRAERPCQCNLLDGHTCCVHPSATSGR